MNAEHNTRNIFLLNAFDDYDLFSYILYIQATHVKRLVQAWMGETVVTSSDERRRNPASIK